MQRTLDSCSVTYGALLIATECIMDFYSDWCLGRLKNP